ncbi:hypothetical protein ACQKEU_05650 [Acidovorax sp. NPDC077664]|uniref:hypothetical protein n=1 Tax=Acidovorax sp. NPDC077664 TaxID=3390544 RepID=UPI003D031916
MAGTPTDRDGRGLLTNPVPLGTDGLEISIDISDQILRLLAHIAQLRAKKGSADVDRNWLAGAVDSDASHVECLRPSENVCRGTTCGTGTNWSPQRERWRANPFAQ